MKWRVGLGVECDLDSWTGTEVVTEVQVQVTGNMNRERKPEEESDDLRGYICMAAPR